MFRSTHLLAPSLLLSLALPACSDDPGDNTPPTDTRPDAAILIAERFSTPDGRVMYMGAFPELPSTAIDITQMIELGEGDAFACAGHAFFFDSDALSLTRYLVGDDLSLTRDLTLQLGSEGITGWTGAHVCASDTAAYMFEGAGGRVVEWNPTTMVITDAFDIPTPNVPQDVDVQFFEPYRAGDLVYFPLEAINWDTLATSSAVLATFDVRDKSVTYAYDTRCGGGLSAHVGADGTLYRYQGYQAFFAEYAMSPQPQDCVLRVLPGQKEFDASYMQALGPTNNMFAIDDTSAVVMQVDPTQPLPSDENLWDWYELPIIPQRVDLATGAMTPYSGLSNQAPMNARKLVLDGQSYFQLNSFDAEGRVTATELMKLAPAGAVPVFTLQGGDFLTLERLW